MGEWLDDLARDLARGLSRRSVLRRMTGGLAAVALATVLPRQAAAAAACDNSHPCSDGCCSMSAAVARQDAAPSA